MALELSIFVHTDEFIVKQPHVALTNSVDTLPAKTRPLDDGPIWPLPNNIGEIGNYPYVSGDTTPIGDERTGTNPPPSYAVEYLVYVSDEGTGTNVSQEQTFDSIDGWSSFLGASGVTLTSRDPQEGDRSLLFDKTSTSLLFGGVVKEVDADYSAYGGLNYFVDVYFPSLTGVSGFRFETEDASGNLHVWETSSLTSGWNTLSFSVDNPLTVVPGFDLSNIKYIRFYVRMTSTAATLSGIELDNFKGTEILSGKISTGDIEVDWVRNSNWQTKFEFDSSLNRWALLEYVLGEISNGPRLIVDASYLNDFSNRPVDFAIDVAGVALNVISVANEAAFTTPSTGNVEFARAETTFNFNTADLDTYTGKEVTYSELADGMSVVDATGNASLERNLNMTFSAGPFIGKKDLSLDFSLDDEVIASELSGVGFVRLSFVPVAGTVELRYDPLPDGYPDPLVEGVDFVIDEDIPAVLFTSTVSNEEMLLDFDVTPGDPGSPDSSVNIYETLQFDNINLVSNTTVVLEGVTTLVEDVDYLLNLEVGQLLLTQGYTEETLIDNVFIEDLEFVDINFAFYINGDELMEYTLVPQAGWVNIDRPLLEGDVPTADYTTSTGTLVVGENLKSPSVEVPGIGRVATTITNEEPAEGGEFSFTVLQPPIQLNKVEIEKDVSVIELTGDRTGVYSTGKVLKLIEDFYYILTAVFSGGITTLTLGGVTQRKYINPPAYYTKEVVTWTSAVGTHVDIPQGVNTFTLLNEATNASSYYEGILLRVGGTSLYGIKGVVIVGADLEISLTTVLIGPILSTDAIEITNTPIPTEGDTTITTFYTPIHDIPDRYDVGGNLLTLDERFPGIGSRSIKVLRNSVELVFGVDYTVSLSGDIDLRDAVTSSETSLVIHYVPFRYSAIGEEITSSYSYFSNSPSGVGLRGSMDYQVPDSFYFRVVNNSTQAAIYQDEVESLIKQKSGRVSAGSSPSVSSSGGNYTKGLITNVSRVGDYYDNDLIAQRIYEFIDLRVGYLEGEKMELCGEVPGGYGGPLTSDDLDESARGSGRLFPILPSVLLSIYKQGQDVALPARPYRLPVLFGQAYEDTGERLIMNSAYPTIPVTTFPPFPPQGETYKGANQEPTAFGVLGVFGTAFSAAAPSTFVEHWYPDSLDRTYVGYVNYLVSPVVVDSTVQGVIQDTGDPATSTPIFPPATLELDPLAFANFNVAVVPLPTYVSAPPRGKSDVPPSYEGMAIGALQLIDDSIEALTLAGVPHRNIIGDPTSYSNFLGWTYRDANEYDLLSNGTSTELSLLDIEWVAGFASRPVDLTSLLENAQAQLLVLNLEKESLVRQQTELTTLVAQISPAPVGDPEKTTYDQAVLFLAEVVSSLVEVQTALNNLQVWYNTVIVGQVGQATDAQIRDRWTFIRGVDVSAVSPPTNLPLTPITLPNRIDQVEARGSLIVTRLSEINNSLGFDNTSEPNFTSVLGSENLYTQRFTFIDLRVNRESGTMFKALAAHAQYVRDQVEAESLLSIVSLLGG